MPIKEERMPMSNPGFVYVLINSALPELIKIGRTQGVPEERARQLSTTGVPAPFIVAYKKLFADCDSAERYVHTLLESQGYRVTANREFFNASISVAIDAVLSAHSHYSAVAISEGGPGPLQPKVNTSTLADYPQPSDTLMMLEHLSAQCAKPWDALRAC